MKYAILYIFAVFFFWECKKNARPETLPKIPKPEIFKWGYSMKKYNLKEAKIKKDEYLETILKKYQISKKRIFEITHQIKKKFDLRKIKIGANYKMLFNKKLKNKLEIFIYFQNKAHYTIVDFSKEKVFVQKIEIPTKKILKKIAGTIKYSLYESLKEKGVDWEVGNQLSEIYAWNINFFKLFKGDTFKVIYEAFYIQDTIFMGVGKIKAAYFKHHEKGFYAFRYPHQNIKGVFEYYNEKALHLRRSFLKAPLKYRNFRISSKFNLRRRIAYYGRIKPHRGTDFAAPIGTPIISTANGKVIESRYKRGNGNYVKIQHNAIYATQYLHMKRRKVRVGQRIKQGQVIGWVGMTGFTSGPHVCYRFWKYGKQIDPLKEKLPPAKKMKKKHIKKYLEYMAPVRKNLDKIKE